MVLSYRWAFCLAVLTIIQVSTCTGPEDYFKPNFTVLKGDPKSWTSETKSRVVQTAATAGGLLYMNAKIPVVIGVSLLVFSYVNLTWTAVGLAIMAYYAYERRNKVALAMGAWAVYCLLNGYSLLPL